LDGRRRWTHNSRGLGGGSIESGPLKADLVEELASSQQLTVRYRGRELVNMSLKASRLAVNAIEECFKNPIDRLAKSTRASFEAKRWNSSGSSFAMKFIGENSTISTDHPLFGTWGYVEHNGCEDSDGQGTQQFRREVSQGTYFEGTCMYIEVTELNRYPQNFLLKQFCDWNPHPYFSKDTVILIESDIIDIEDNSDGQSKLRLERCPFN
jgi:hypothetical protein